MANRGAGIFVAGSNERNTVRLLLGPWRPLIDNWDEVAGALVERLGADLLRFPDDATLRAMHDEVRAVVGPATAVDQARDSRVVCPRFRIDGQVVRTMTVAARFESVADITLEELRVELIYPEDDASERFFRARAADSGGRPRTPGAG